MISAVRLYAKRVDGSLSAGRAWQRSYSLCDSFPDAPPLTVARRVAPLQIDGKCQVALTVLPALCHNRRPSS
jgi:hypothetical protein